MSTRRKEPGDDRLHGESRVRVTPCDGLLLEFTECVEPSDDFASLRLMQVHLRNDHDRKGNESYVLLHAL